MALLMAFFLRTGTNSMMCVKIIRFSVFARSGVASAISCSLEDVVLALKVERAHDQVCPVTGFTRGPNRARQEAR